MSLFGEKSPFGFASLQEAVNHLVRKIDWFSDGMIKAKIFSADDNAVNEIKEYNGVIAMNLSSKSDLDFASNIFASRITDRKDNHFHFALNCNNDPEGLLRHTVVGPYDEFHWSSLGKILPWSKVASAERMKNQMDGLFERWSSDDFVLALLLFFNQFSGTNIPWVEHSIDATWEKGPVRNAKEFFAMTTNCGDCIGKCLADENCKQCIDALNAVDTRDQVASYRTVVSFESELLRDFSFCILQKNNIFGCSATIPTQPYVEPLTSWRGNSLTAEDASKILIGHLDDEDAPEGGRRLETSWKVACGANVAYDQFPSQNQIVYYNKAGRDLWYDPVFRVETIDGRNVWAKRHYKVRKQKVPGTFRFSVLDNGVTSDEFWTIVGCADDLSWIVFHYAGAAGAVGQRYIGGLLCTPDGSLDNLSSQDLELIWSTCRSAGIEPWELYLVDNNEASEGALAAGPPPLDYFRKTAGK